MIPFNFLHIGQFISPKSCSCRKLLPFCPILSLRTTFLLPLRLKGHERVRVILGDPDLSSVDLVVDVVVLEADEGLVPPDDGLDPAEAGDEVDVVVPLHVLVQLVEDEPVAKVGVEGSKLVACRAALKAERSHFFP